jgi:hypothetical protein
LLQFSSELFIALNIKWYETIFFACCLVLVQHLVSNIRGDTWTEAIRKQGTKNCWKLPHGSFASSDRASAHAQSSGRVWEAAVRGTTGLGFSTLATWPAPANFWGFPPPGRIPPELHQSHNSKHTVCSSDSFVSNQYLTSGPVQCVNPQTNYEY